MKKEHGVIYFDTGRIEDKLGELEVNTILYNEFEFYEYLKIILMTNPIYFINYKKFIYQDLNNIFVLESKDIKW